MPILNVPISVLNPSIINSLALPKANIVNRPFSTEPISGFMLPDGIFEIIFDRQSINVQLTNTGNDAETGTLYFESASNPNIIVASDTYSYSLEPGSTQVFQWMSGFKNCTPGIHYLSFIVKKNSGSEKRLIKKIFVSQTVINADGTAVIKTPEGAMSASLQFLAAPNQCLKKDVSEANRRPPKTITSLTDIARQYAAYIFSHNPTFKACLPGILIKKGAFSFSYKIPYQGQYGPLPFQDPWWKVLLCIVAAIIALAAAITTALSGGDVSVNTGSGGSGSSGGAENCCGFPDIEAGGSSYVAAGLWAAAAAVATIAGFSDDKDPMRRGQENTPLSSPNEQTISENVNFELKYIDAIEPGKPFKIGLDWKYERHTNVKTYTYQASDIKTNQHVLSRYVITAANRYEVHPSSPEKARQPWIITGQFYDGTNALFKGKDLLVQCFLIGPAGEYIKFFLQDYKNDGNFKGAYGFKQGTQGRWKYYVIAQDINDASPNMKPEEAAQIIGGLVLTNQVKISFQGGQCQLVPDGQVEVV